ncbi:MAG: ketopantoate reductase family protein [Dehalococcoidia bacterium]
MRVLIVGGGGLGTVLAGCLARTGAEVLLLVKPAHAAAFERQEVRITGSVEFSAPVHVLTGTDTLPRVDSAIICVKGRDTDSALAALSGLETDAVLSVQNGVLKDELIARAFGPERLLGAVSGVAGTLVRPGVAFHPFAGATLVGEPDGRVSDRGERLAAALWAGGLPAASVPDIVPREWYKLTGFLRTALVCSISHCDIATAALDADLGPVCAAIALEVAHIAASEGHPIWRFPPACGGFGTAEPDACVPGDKPWDIEDVLSGLREAGADLRARAAVVFPSMAQDTIAEKPSELEFTAGDVLARAGRHEVPVPVLEACTRLLRGMGSMPFSAAPRR